MIGVKHILHNTGILYRIFYNAFKGTVGVIKPKILDIFPTNTFRTFKNPSKHPKH